MNSVTRLEDLGAAVARSGGPASEVDIGQLLRTLWRRRWVILSITGLSLVAAYFILSQVTPIYTATTRVMIESRRSRVLDGRELISGMEPFNMAVMSEVEVIRSRNIAKRVADKLDLYNDKQFNPALMPNEGSRVLGTLSALIGEVSQLFATPGPQIDEATRLQRQRDAVVDKVLGSLSVEPVQLSLVIRVSMQSPDPVMAARLANAYADACVEEQLESKFDTVRHISTWLNGRLDSLRTAVVESERAVAAYRSANGLVDTSQRGQSMNQQQLSELSSQLVMAQSKRAETEARLSRVEGALMSGHTEGALDDMLDSPLVQHLKEEQATLARTVTELKARYGERHPDMVKAKSELAQIDRQLTAEIQSLVKTLRNDFAVQKQREASLSAQIRSAEGSVLTQSKAEIRLHELERDAQANRVLYESFLSKFKESGEQEQFQQADTRVIAQAEVPRSPSYPRRPMVLTAATVLGLLGGVALVLLLEQLDRTVRTRDQLEELVGLPTFALIPQIKSGTGETAVQSYIMDHPSSSYAEAFRMAWVGLQQGLGDQGSVVVVTSSVPEEGKSLTSLSLARVVSTLGLRVIVIDADLRRASLAAKAGVQSQYTFPDVIAGRVTVDEAIINDPLSPADIMISRPGGHKDVNLLASSDRVAEILNGLRSRYDLVVVDSPPALAMADVQVLSRMADKTVFCVRWDQTPRETVLSALRVLRDAKAKMAGLLLTRVDISKHSRYGYHDVGYYYARYRNYYSE
ncbi:GumC family protein [Nitrospirillum iridis]|uniref:non-specific protein-tyrosine kinase n=1 Tax=Nitrospirillum iridis TaxID=765888 RepID=A0A7X0B2V7_9PROT|nr:Wzz/FepE/Etk N-terminal domain-containing protein [Nitrospirillum iridis]MBB6253705.1 capsular exopolysaccharide synthesis family protein [Nitrospirillum iridis]